MNTIILLCVAAAIVIILLVHNSVENYNAKIKISLFLKQVQSLALQGRTECSRLPDPKSQEIALKKYLQANISFLKFVVNMRRFPDRSLSYFVSKEEQKGQLLMHFFADFKKVCKEFIKEKNIDAAREEFFKHLSAAVINDFSK